MSEDSDLQRAVLAEINWEPSVIAAHIGVTANAGVVTLSGHVASYAEKRAAETAAKRVRGVKAVAEEIDVHLAMDSNRTDTAIAAAILERFAWDGAIPRDSVKARVESGWVTLSGEVEWFYQHEAAEEDVHRLTGVIGVSNQIVVRPGANAVRVNTGAISDDITHALHRSWFFEGSPVKVSAHGGHVRLSGQVTTLHERAVAAATAWSAPGTTSVDNEIVIA